MARAKREASIAEAALKAAKVSVPSVPLHYPIRIFAVELTVLDLIYRLLLCKDRPPSRPSLMSRRSALLLPHPRRPRFSRSPKSSSANRSWRGAEGFSFVCSVHASDSNRFSFPSPSSPSSAASSVTPSTVATSLNSVSSFCLDVVFLLLLSSSPYEPPPPSRSFPLLLFLEWRFHVMIDSIMLFPVNSRAQP